jgi:curli biogenesis system outer membrane secretion channel CsgG
VAREIVARLVNSSQFDVIDRADIAKIMKEKNYHNDARFNGGAAEAGRIGRILNVDAIIVGTIETVSSQVNDHKIGIGLAVGGKREAEADVSVTIRVLSTQTSQIFLADTADKKEKHSLGAGGGYGTKANSGSGAEAQYPGAYPLTLALQHAADDLADKIIARAAALQPRGIGDTQNAYSSVPGNAAFSGGAHTPNENSTSSAPAPAITSATPFLPLVVGKVDGKKIYITAGSNAGVTMNQAVEVRRVNGSMKDPNGVDIPLEDTVEVAVVTEVEDRYAIAEVQRSDKSSAKVGDKIKLVQPATKEQAQKDKAHRSKVPWKAFVLP